MSSPGRRSAVRRSSPTSSPKRMKRPPLQAPTATCPGPAIPLATVGVRSRESRPAPERDIDVVRGTTKGRPEAALRVVRGKVLDRRGGGLLGATRQERLAGDHEALNLRRALVELHDLRVAHELLDGVLLDEAVPAVDLYGVGGDL